MTSFLLLILDVILAATAYMIYISLFIPTIKKNSVYAKLTAKQRAELDVRLGLQEYFGMTEETEKTKK